MDIKSKSYKPSKVWAKFFIGVSIFIIVISISILVLSDMESARSFGRMLINFDLKDTQEFKHQIALKFDTLAKHVIRDIAPGKISDEQGEYLDRKDRAYLTDLDKIGGLYLTDEGDNLIYYGKNLETGRVFTNVREDVPISRDGTIVMPEGYNYYLLFDSGDFTAQNDGEPLDIYKLNSGYGEVLSIHEYSNDKSLAKTQILLIVKEDIVENPYANSMLHMIKRQNDTIKWAALIGLAVLSIGMGLIIYALKRREYKKEYDRKIAKTTGNVCLELKLIIALALIILLFIAGENYSMFWYYDGYSEHILPTIFIALIYFWWIYFIILDIKINRRDAFSKNIVSWGIRKYKEFENRQPFQRGLLIRDYLTIGIALVLSLIIGIFMWIWGEHVWNPWIILLGIAIPPTLMAYLHFRKYKKAVDDIGKAMVHVEEMQRGDMSHTLSIAPGSDLYALGEELNEVQLGFNRAIEQSLKSERMKVELITNISHDLKTPLTSITSYVDLLSKEEGLPEHVGDYINILEKKAHRLNILIEDLFDLSKAVSGDMIFEWESIDLGKLIDQTLGDMQERIEESRLQFRVNIPDSPVNIISDGKKLYRVLANLITNTLKYTLEGTRVYIDLNLEGELALVTIKNIANYEMDFDRDEIMERFVRGDKARTSEGSGLGLAIAQSFTLSCGGDFGIDIDGDLFKVILSFEVNNR